MKQRINKAAFWMLTAWLVILAAICHAQRPFEYKYTLADGLPLIEVEFIRFSNKGEVWVAFTIGEYLPRFDGAKWTHYRMDSLEPLPYPAI